MAKEYLIIIGLIIFLMLQKIIGETLVIWYPIIVLTLSIYSIYRQSTIFQKYRLKDNRHFIKSKYDKPNFKKELIIGIVLSVAGIIFYVTKGTFNIEENLNIIITSSLLAIGLTNILLGLFFTPNPITEILVGKYSIQVIRGTRLVKEFYEISDFRISNDNIKLGTNKKWFELDSLELTSEQEHQLTNEFNTLMANSNNNINKRKRTILRLKRYFSFK